MLRGPRRLIYGLSYVVLLQLGTPVDGAFPASAAGKISENGRQSAPFIKVRTTDRVTADLPAMPVELAQPVRIPLKLGGPGVRTIYVTQDDGKQVLTNRQGKGNPIGNGTAKVVAEDEAGKTIEITPLRVGDVHLEVTVEFSDGAEEIETYTINVEPTSAGLKKLTLNQGLKVFTLHMTGSQMNERFLEPEAYYEGLDYPIDLPRDLSAIQIAVKQSESNPVIRIDGDGKIHALRKGKATIIGEFRGITDQVTAIVE